MSVPKTMKPMLVVVAALCLAAAWNAPAAAKNKLTGSQIQEYNTASSDSSRAQWAMGKLREFLADDPDSTYALLARRMIVRAMFTLRMPGPQITALIDSAGRTLPKEPQVVVFYYGQLAQDLMDRGMEPMKALEYAHRAAEILPGDVPYGPLRGMIYGTLGRALLLTQRPDSAITTLLLALPATPDSQRVLAFLGQAYEKARKPDLAINAYTRSLAMYLGKDTTAAAPLRALWKKKNGSLAGMEKMIEVRRASSRKVVALDSRRHSGAAPPWALSYLDGKPVSSDEFKGKVIVLDFWGSWCGPCRAELPIFQAVYERYREKGVVFLGMNFERPQQGRDLKELARDFMERNKYTFPVVVDHDQVASNAYGITGFPTVFLIDKAGNFRYKNVGVSEGIETILTDQIESLID